MKELFAFIEKHSFILLFFVLQIISFILIVNFNEPQKSQYGAVSTAFCLQDRRVQRRYFQFRPDSLPSYNLL